MKLRKLFQRISFLLNCCFHLLIFSWITPSTSASASASSSRSSLSRNSISSGDSQRVKPDPVMIRLFETNMLKALGLKSRPRPDRSRIIISDPMLELYYRHTGQNANLAKWKRSKNKPGRIADTVRSFSPTYGDDVWMMGHKEMMAFDMASLPLDEDIKAAEVKIFINQSWSFPLDCQSTSQAMQKDISDGTRNNHRFIVRINEILQKNGQDIISRPIDSKLVDVTNNSRWVTFDILPAVLRWQMDASSNLGLEVEMTSPSGDPLFHEHFSPHLTFINPIRQRRSIPSTANSTSTIPTPNPEKQPVMMVHSNEGKSKSSKSSRRPQNRPSSSQGSHRQRNLCKRMHLYVDFADVQWTDWIVAPPGYTAYHCAGDCSYPLPDHLNTTNHAVVQSLVHHANSANRGAPAAPNPCCVPTELSPISLLYVDEYDKVVLKNYQDMVVEGCGCR